MSNPPPPPYRDVFWRVLQSKNIPASHIKYEDKNEYIALLKTAVPPWWHVKPQRVGFIDMILMGRSRSSEDFFWDSEDFLFDRGMLEVFHNKYVNEPHIHNPVKVYLSILSYMYELFVHSANENTLHQSLSRIHASLEEVGFPNIPHKIPLEIFTDAEMDYLIATARIEGIDRMVPNSFTSFNIIGFLNKHTDVKRYIETLYDIDPFVNFSELSYAHFWIAHFRTVYGFFTKYCIKK